MRFSIQSLLVLTLTVMACFVVVPAQDFALGPNLTTVILPTVDCSYGSLAGRDQYFPEKLTDGVRMNQKLDPRSAYQTTHASCQADVEHWIEISFAAPQLVGTIVNFWAFNNFQEDYMAPQEVHASVWNDASTAWTEVGVMYPKQGVFPDYSDTVTIFSFAPVTTSKIRVVNPANQGWAAYNNIFWCAEMEAYSLQHSASVKPHAQSVFSGNLNLAVSANAGSRAQFAVQVPEQAVFDLSVYTTAGKKEWTTTGMGQQKVIWTPDKASPGLRLAVVKQGQRQVTKRFLMLP